MQKTTVKKIKTLLKYALGIYILAGVALYFFQEKILFHPVALPDTHVFQFSSPFREINLPVNEKKNISIIQFTVPDSLCKGVVLYFHGNRKNVERYAPFAVNFTRNHYEVWMIDYPGFGKSTGKRTEQILYEDAAVLYKMARSRFAKDSIILYGKSMGTGIAAQLASVRDCKSVILETPYYSIKQLLKHYAFIYPIDWLAHYNLSTNEYLQKVDAPLSIFHGTKDEVIPYKQSTRLARENPKLELFSIEGGKHNNLNDSPLYQHKLDSLLQLP